MPKQMQEDDELDLLGPTAIAKALGVSHQAVQQVLKRAQRKLLILRNDPMLRQRAMEAGFLLDRKRREVPRDD